MLEKDLTPADLRPGIATLRDEALTRHQEGIHAPPTMPLIDARAWSEPTDDEDWLIWRARRAAARLREMPLELLAGERIVGRPALRPPTVEERQDLTAANEVLSSMPPYPGGDSGHFHPDCAKLFAAGIGGILDEVAGLVEELF